MRLAAQAKGGFYPTPSRVVDLIAEQIQPPARYDQRNPKTLRILDPCCGAGEAAAQLAGSLDGPNTIPIETHGVELHRDRAAEAESRLDRVLAADLFATSMANGAFGLLYLNPPYDWDSGGQADEARLPHALHAVPRRARAAGVHRAQTEARRLGPLPVHPLRAAALLGLPRT